MSGRWPALAPHAFLLLGTATLAVASIVALELRGDIAQPAAVSAMAAQGSISPMSAVVPNGGGGDQANQRVARILGRPLFTPGRRPEAPGAAGSFGLARLTGVTVSPLGKTAIFAGAPGGKPVVIEEGSRIGGYVVGTIEAGAVTVIGPDGLRVLHPSFDPSPPARPVGGSPVAAPGSATVPAQVPTPRQPPKGAGLR